MKEAGTALSPEVIARALQRFRTLRGRGAALRFNLLCPLVHARTPEELREKTERDFIEATLKLQAS
jgi:hypothetical protein